MKKVTVYLFLMIGMAMNNYLHAMNSPRKNKNIRKKVLMKAFTNPIKSIKKYDVTPLHTAAKIGDEKNITAWITKYKWPVDIQNNKGQTPLHFAVQHNQIKSITLLLKHGAKPNAQDNQGNTTLYYLPNKFINEEIAKGIVYTLFTHHAKLNIINKDGDSMLHVLLKNKKNDVCKILRRYRKPFFNEIKMLKDRNDNTPLHVACSNCMYMLVHNLLCKETINAKNTQEETPLDITITLYNKLLEIGEDAYAKAIHTVIKYLEDFGATATVLYTKPSKPKT